MPKKSFYKQSTKVEAASTATVLEVEKPTKFTKLEEGAPPTPKRRARWGWWIFLTSIVLLLVVIGSIASTGWWYFNTFERAAGVKLYPLVKNVFEQRNVNFFQERDYKTFLLLGLDQSQNLREESLLTDTMMLAIVRKDGNIGIISLPRDLWIESLKTKINALYYYGQQTNPEKGVSLVSSVVSEITGLPVDYHFVITMDTVTSLIDALGGIEVNVERAFTDPQYPREIDLTSKDPSILYETVRFNAGMQHMDGATSLKFIRSRHSEDEFEGTDAGRERRQQVLLSALKQSLFNPTIVSNPTVAGSLYKVWKTYVQTNCTDLDFVLLAKDLNRNSLQVVTTTIPITDKKTQGLIHHPDKGPINQWVYVPTDSTWQELKNWFGTFVH